MLLRCRCVGQPCASQRMGQRGAHRLCELVAYEQLAAACGFSAARQPAAACQVRRLSQPSVCSPVSKLVAMFARRFAVSGTVREHPAYTFEESGLQLHARWTLARLCPDCLQASTCSYVPRRMLGSTQLRHALCRLQAVLNTSGQYNLSMQLDGQRIAGSAPVPLTVTSGPCNPGSTLVTSATAVSRCSDSWF